jgi:hypothetical protein
MARAHVLATLPVMALLFKLDSCHEPGLTEVEFRALFYKCQCGVVATKRTFQRHACHSQHEVIDLTCESDDEDSSANRPIVIDLTLDTEDELL